MLQQQISRKIDVLVDWAASYITRSYPKLEKDHQTTALFKSILMTIDSTHFRTLLSRPTTIRQLELQITQYFATKFNQTKETVLQGGNDQYTPMKVLVMFKMIFELAYLTSRQQCTRAVSSLDFEGRQAIGNISNEIANQGRGTKTSKQSQESELRKLREENKKLKLVIQSLKVRESELIQKNAELEKRVREAEYINLLKDLQLQESNRKMEQFQTIIKQVSVEVFKQQKLEDDEQITESFDLTNALQQTDKDQKNSQRQWKQEKSLQVREMRSTPQRQQKSGEGWYVKKLQNQWRKSSEIVQRFQLLKQIHGQFKQEVRELFT